MLSIGLISGIENFLFAQKIAQFDILLMKYPALQENIGRDRVAGLSDEEIEKDLDIIEGKALFYLTPQEIGKRLGRTEETLKTTMRYDLSQKIGDYEKARHYQLPREHIEMRIIYSKYLGVSASLLIKNDSIWDRIWPQCKVSETWIEAISNFIDRIIFSRYALASLLSTMSFFYVTLAVLCSFLSHWLPWEQRSKYFRVTCFIIACWITGSIAYFVLFPPQIYPYYGLRHFALITFVPPIIGGSLSYIYYRYIK
jgi:hypothetical protein